MDNTKTTLLGLDIGSTTVKAVVTDSLGQKTLFRAYRRHGARQRAVVRGMLKEIEDRFGKKLRVTVCGSGGEHIATELGAFYAQEVVANAVVVRRRFPQVRTAVELGGQDAKVIIFDLDPKTGNLTPGDLRMNGVCAGGTGAFLDQMATLVGFPVERFNEFAKSGKRVYEISGRCGVFAKTDIQPLLNQGVSREDIALSSLHAVAKQTIGGLAQGVEIRGPVIFEGGPLTFVDALVGVFAERLSLSAADILVPDHPETLVAEGAALCGLELFGDKRSGYRGSESLSAGKTPNSAVKAACTSSNAGATTESRAGSPTRSDDNTGVSPVVDYGRRQELGRAKPFFPSPEDRAAFEQRHRTRGTTVDWSRAMPPFAIGIDAGSTTTKVALLDSQGALVDSFYGNNRGEPLAVGRAALLEILDRAESAGIEPKIACLGTTGYGEKLFAKAFGADYSTVETVAHAEAARRYLAWQNRSASDAGQLPPPPSSPPAKPGDTNSDHGLSDYTVLDIGGQDIKAIRVRNGVVTNITLNEACSAGCGSFLESYVESLQIPVADIAKHAFASPAPSTLGSRCTVFMNSSIITEQKNGKTTDDILAGLCRSIIENVFTKVVRLRNTKELGNAVVAQGGTLRNDAVLRALEEHAGVPVIRPDVPGLMGAVGIALLAQRATSAGHIGPTLAVQGAAAAGAPKEASGAATAAAGAGTGGQQTSRFIGRHGLEEFSYRTREGVICRGCSNSCSRTIITFTGGDNTSAATANEQDAGQPAATRSFVTGNRCERGELDHSTHGKRDTGPFVLQDRLLTKQFVPIARDDRPKTRIGLPRVLEFWQSLPYWKAVFESCGFEVVVSKRSSPALFERGLHSVLSDTICLPAKLVHGHILDLIERGAVRIFFPSMIRTIKDNPKHAAAEVCPIVQGYPIVADISDETMTRYGVPMDRPALHFFDEKTRFDQTVSMLVNHYDVDKDSARRAVENGRSAEALFQNELEEYGATTKDRLETNQFAVVIAGRPYHSDSFVNHQIAAHFERLGVPVLSIPTLPESRRHALRHSRLETYNTFHSRMLAVAQTVAEDPRLELVQIVSFGCGHDALLSDEMNQILREGSEKESLVLKLDEGDAPGPLSIRIRSFVETVRRRRAAGTTLAPVIRAKHESFPLKFLRRHRRHRTVWVPVLSKAFSEMSVRVLLSLGYKAKALPAAGRRAVELGKKHVHNDICYPAQINVGEMLAHLESGFADPKESCLGLAKNCIACRAGQYAGLARKALDEAGYPDVRILTTGKDEKNMHPGFNAGPRFLLKMLVGLAVVDALEYMRRRIRPYELQTGNADAVFETELARCTEAANRSLRRGLAALRRSIAAFNRIVLAEQTRKPRVGILGEILMNYHETANGHVERYLEAFGLEVVVPDMTDFFRRKNIVQRAMADKSLHPHPRLLRLLATTKELAYAFVHGRVEKVLRGFLYYEPRSTVREVVKHTRNVIDPSYLIGEGWLMPAEILEMAGHGVQSFVILNPFGCMPNHITGRGMIKEIKRRRPEVHILALDYDPDTPWANIENRLQMLIMTAKGLHTRAHAAYPTSTHPKSLESPVLLSRE